MLARRLRPDAFEARVCPASGVTSTDRGCGGFVIVDAGGSMALAVDELA